ncbi:transglutaminase-like domain-containing protein [Exiguobacterium profundum]|uniref:transglutaminase-like domain-containing protein n=1 Tax=Exiguobacterium profundum TaxID=307643 RepID=UPI00289C2061|nr:transglutaminase domain-containing protein [Exiguobacterium profundum]
MKKFFAGILVLLFVFFVFRPNFADAASTAIDGRAGKVSVYLSSKDQGVYKFEVKRGNQVRHYDVFKGKNQFNLTFGNGDYTFTLYRSGDGKRYNIQSRREESVRLSHSTAPYLHSTQNVSIDSATVKLAKTLSRSSYSSTQQALVTSRHLNKTISYDYKKLTKLSTTYLPNNTNTLKMKRGICYDFASLNAAILRKQGIPTRLVMGTAKGVDGYHAWNEVYVDKKWRILDVTRDVTEKRATAFRTASDYRADTIY